MWTLVVVVLEEVDEYAAEVALVADHEPVVALSTHGLHESLCVGFGDWARIGVRITRIPSVAKTSSKTPVNFLSRSRISLPTLTGGGCSRALRLQWRDRAGISPDFPCHYGLRDVGGDGRPSRSRRDR
jgi:hypothetical protein